MQFCKWILLLVIVYDQCAKYSMRSSNAGPVNLTLYYESMCPDCIEFIHSQLYRTWKKLGSDVLDITLVPYGNAEEEQTPFGDWKYTCQHGHRECVGNVIETCAISILEEFDTYFPFIYCMETGDDPETAGPKCAQKLDIEYSAIGICARGKTGNRLEHKMARATEDLDPPHEFVPWVTLNDVHTEKMNYEAVRDLLSLVCKMYKGPTPSSCQSYHHSREKRCYKD